MDDVPVAYHNDNDVDTPQTASDDPFSARQTFQFIDSSVRKFLESIHSGSAEINNVSAKLAHKQSSAATFKDFIDSAAEHSTALQETTHALHGIVAATEDALIGIPTKCGQYAVVQRDWQSSLQDLGGLIRQKQVQLENTVAGNNTMRVQIVQAEERLAQTLEDVKAGAPTSILPPEFSATLQTISGATHVPPVDHAAVAALEATIERKRDTVSRLKADRAEREGATRREAEGLRRRILELKAKIAEMEGKD